MKCKNDTFMKMVSVEKLDKQVEVDFDVQRNLPSCNRINAKKYVETDAESPKYEKYTIPQNAFECLNNNCVNSGTLYVESGNMSIYQFSNAESFAAGAITFYVTENVGSVAVSISDSKTFTNAWKYTMTPGAVGADGFAPVIVDLTETPTEIGTGWTPTEGIAYIGIVLTVGTGLDGPVGLSSIALFEDIEDFNTSTHVKVGCLTSVDGTWDLDIAESSCFGNGYDMSSRPTFEKTVTGNKVTANYWRLNPLYKRGSATEGFDIVTVERTVQAGDGYGTVLLSDMNQNECGFFSAMIAENCAADELDKLSIPMLVNLDGGHYLLIDNGDGTTTVVFNEMHIGRKALISYPRLVDVEEFVLDANDIDEVRTRMSYTKTFTDGNKYRFVFDNVLITSFPDALTEDESEFAFTVSIQPDMNGRYGRAFKIID